MDIVNVRHAKISCDLARIIKAGSRMIQGQQTGRFELSVQQNRKVTDATADIGNLHPRPQPVPGQQIAFMPPRQTGLISQNGDETTILKERLAGIEVFVVFGDGNIPKMLRDGREFACRPTQNAGGDNHNLQLRMPA